MRAEPLVVKAFRLPAAAASFRLAEWDLLIRQARRANLLASLYALLEDHGLLDAIPPQPREHLYWAWIFSERHAQAVRWEVRLIGEALAETGVPLILLKGAAYVLAQLPPARGRIFSDIDILVPKSRLGAVEAALMLHGWAGMHLDKYDQRYYRTWMHELPPMQHIRRMTAIDVHHAIVPETAGIRPDPAKLRAAAIAAGESAPVSVLCPTDMVLHSAVHLFHEGEFDHGLRDLIDIHRLLLHYGDAPAFWPALAARARELEATRPLFYALRYANRMLDTPVPAQAIGELADGRPDRRLLALMDQLFLRAFIPDHASCCGRLDAAARAALYVRANWLRMPAPLLARHLFHKAFLSPRSA
jgi:diadenosine tetraphosphatase ApaH/serine/threonine PP2A family protein phosphatase